MAAPSYIWKESTGEMTMLLQKKVCDRSILIIITIQNSKIKKNAHSRPFENNLQVLASRHFEGTKK
jgi:hypothetical protein